MECRKCQPGYYCPKPDTETQVTGSDKYALEGSTFVSTVPYGYRFVSTSQEPIQCSAGTYWASSDCTKCTAGNFCPADATSGLVGTAEIPCPSGFYTDHEYATDCYMIPAGYKATGSATSGATSITACDAG